MAKTDFTFSTRFRVRWSEVDPQGVVFNARYLEYADIGITEYYRALDRDFWNEPLEFHVKRATVTWARPIKSDEVIDVYVRTARTGTTSVTQLIEIHGANETDAEDLRAEVELVNVHVDLSEHRPMPLPEWLPAMYEKLDKPA